MSDEKRQKSGDLAPRTLLAASVAGALATAAISGAGLAGSLIGGAVFPIIITVARELVLRVVDRTPRPRIATPGGVTRRPARRRPAIRWRRVAVTAGAAVAIVVSTYTVAEIFLGESVVSDRRTTFFTNAPAAPSSPDADPGAPPDAGDPATTTETTRTPPPQAPPQEAVTDPTTATTTTTEPAPDPGTTTESAPEPPVDTTTPAPPPAAPTEPAPPTP